MFLILTGGCYQRGMPIQLSILEYDDALAGDFYRINAAWIEDMFTLEKVDRDVLENPRKSIIDSGGAILFVSTPDMGVVGTCALQKTGEATYELTKMGVESVAQGLNIGNHLLQAMIAAARQMEAKQLYLLTNWKCAAAVHLYEKHGFVHDVEIMETYGKRYARCNVAMSYPIAD
jgi:N-acetylglutamate synthase-like GNAT family acetyltransferase